MRHILSTVFLIVLLAGCSQTDGNNQETRADDEEAIRAAYDAWANAADTKDIDSWVTFLGPDAIFLPPNTEALTTYEDIRDLYVSIFEDPNWSISCEHTEVEIAEAGDMAWSRGYCNTTVSGPDGTPIESRGKWNKVWLKQADGSWKNRLNSFSPTQQSLQPPMSTAQKEDVVQEITSILDAYADAVANWDREEINSFWGDYDGFVFAGDGIILGGSSDWAETLDQYEAQVERWINFEYRNTHVEALSINAATATTEFEHSRITTEGDTVNVKGAWTYVFKKVDGKWNVVQTNGTHLEF